MFNGRLRKSADNEVFGGVCSGLARWLRINPLGIRLLFVLAALSSYGIFEHFGTGSVIIAYIVLYFCMEDDISDTSSERRE